MKTTYSRRELYALGEPFGDSATQEKLGGGYVCGGGGGGLLGAIVAVVAVVALGPAAAVVDAAPEITAETIGAFDGIPAADVAASTGTTATTTTAAITAEATTAESTAAANSINTDQLIDKMGQGALRGAATTAAKDVITGKTDNLGSDILTGGLAGMLGAGAGNLATQELGAGPITSGAIQGGVGAGAGAALSGNPNVGAAIERGALSGGAGGATSSALQNQDLTPTEKGAIAGAVQGGVGAVLNKGDIGTGVATGGIGGAAGTAVGNEVTQSTGSKLLGSVLGSTAGYVASTEAGKMLNGAPTIPTIQASGQRTGNATSGMPTASSYGNPTAANTINDLGGQTGIPNQAETTAGTSYAALPGNYSGAGILSGSNPLMNTGTASNAGPSSGLNARGMPAPLSSGTMTSQMPTSEQTAKIAQLAQLYPQLAQVDPRIMASLVSSAPTQNYKKGGRVHMSTGGQPDILAKLKEIDRKSAINNAMHLMSEAQKSFTPSSSQYADNVPYGNPTGQHNKPLIPGYFITRMKDGGATKHDEHIPEFITGATGHYVKGKGDGQSDDIPAMLADGEYVFDADTVASLGNGSSDAGAKLLDHFREALREHKRSAPSDKIPPQASPLAYMKEALKRHKKG
jgi:hypothetical protein